MVADISSRTDPVVTLSLYPAVVRTAWTPPAAAKMMMRNECISNCDRLMIQNILLFSVHIS